MVKLYTLTICYNEDKDEIEYIEETVDSGLDKIVRIGDNKLKDHFTDDEICEISIAEFGEA